MAFDLGGTFDLQPTAKRLPEGVVVCCAKIVAGPQHMDAILNQAREYWKRGEFLARNRSIDLLMRITCQRQISEAVSASEIDKAREIALFGLVTHESQIRKSTEIIEAVSRHLVRDDDMMMLDRNKLEYLRKFHKLPTWFSETQLVTALKERSVLLIFK